MPSMRLACAVIFELHAVGRERAHRGGDVLLVLQVLRDVLRGLQAVVGGQEHGVFPALLQDKARAAARRVERGVVVGLLLVRKALDPEGVHLDGREGDGLGDLRARLRRGRGLLAVRDLVLLRRAERQERVVGPGPQAHRQADVERQPCAHRGQQPPPRPVSPAPPPSAARCIVHGSSLQSAHLLCLYRL